MLQALIDHLALLNTFRNTERVVYVPGQDRLENDLEHTCTLALAAWFLVDVLQLPYSKERVLELALAHDLVEIHAGDTFFYAPEEIKKQKAEKESEAQKLLQNNYPNWPRLHEVIEDYQTRSSDEAKFVAALDKILPIIHIMQDGGRIWREKHISLDDLERAKREKIAISPIIMPLFEELVTMLKKDEEKYFGGALR